MSRAQHVVITGGSGGIGLALCERLLRRGAEVLFVSSHAGRAEQAEETLLQRTGRRPRPVIADLATAGGVQSAARQILGWSPKIDVLVNSASAISSVRRTTADGLEHTFALNYLAYFHLTGLLIDVLSSGRVINVSAAPVAWARIRFDDLQFTHRYSAVNAYLQAKLADVMFTYELARRRPNVTAVAVHPGIVRTNLGQGLTRGLLPVLLRPLRRFAEEADASASRLEDLVVAETLPSGAFYAYGRVRRSAPASYDLDRQAALWAASLALLGYDPYGAPVESAPPASVPVST